MNFYRKVITKTPALIVEVLNPMGECFDRLSLQDQKIKFLRENSVGQEQVIFQCGQEILRQEGAEEAFDFLVSKVSLAPSLNGLIELLEVQGRLEVDVVGRSLDISKVARKLRQASLYKCEECGFQASELHWQCPACKQWGKVNRV